MSAFWKGARRGVIYAWLIAGVPSAILSGGGGYWTATGLCAFGFILAVIAFRDTTREGEG